LSGIAIFFIGFRGIIHHRKAMLSDEDTSTEMAKSMTKPFLTGFLINFTNLGTHFFWLTLSSTVFTIWRNAGKLPFLVFSVSVVLGLFICIFTINLCIAKGFKAYLSALSTKISHILAYALAVLGIGFITYGIYKTSDFIR
jgi:threonine/homoserine/homoserine lactone efflux protein